ncbi:MAG: glycosyltransferase family 39 protein [Deltaproteobacteria bacterium]|jgi:4-amino-4-deoxy-L-arabinose transferase-like glycosyltransferase|nr:glycosyltransferase family 39 protein [Deltaproteobacteria bacterium]
MNRKWINITYILFFALFLRLLFFVGFALGDDPNYADRVYAIIEGHYPSLCKTCVFAFRPILLFFTALPLKYFGWSEFSFILPVLLSSLISIYLIYALGKLLFDQRTGLLAAFCLAIFPLNIVHATTMSNDIMLSMLMALSMLLFLKGLEEHGKKTVVYLTLSGFVLGVSVGVKINALPVVGLFILIALLNRWQKKEFRYEVVFFLLSWLIVQALFSIVYYIKTGDFLAHVHAEINFDKEYNPSSFINKTCYLKDALLYYPKHMLSIVSEGHPGYTFYPYGFFYPVFLLAIVFFLFRREKKVVIPLIWFSYLFLMMEFTPLKFSPYYQPIHRLIRFLSIVSIPALLVTAYFFKKLFEGRILAKLVFLLLIIGLFVTSLHQAYRKSYFYRDCMSDGRKAYDLIKHMPCKQVITDWEMKKVLLFYRKLDNNKIKVKSFERDRIQFLDGSIVIFGGARRPDMYPGYPTEFVKSTPPKSNWVEIYEVKGKEEMWRERNLVIYKIVSKRKGLYERQMGKKDRMVLM